MLEVIKEDALSIQMVMVALRRAHFYHIEGEEVSRLEQSRMRLMNLKLRIDNHLADLEKQTLEEMKRKAEEKEKIKEPVKSDKKGK